MDDVRRTAVQPADEAVLKATRGLWTEPEAAGYCKTTPRHLRELRYTGRIPYLRVGKLIRYRPADLDAWLDAQAVRAER